MTAPPAPYGPPPYGPPPRSVVWQSPGVIAAIVVGAVVLVFAVVAFTMMAALPFAFPAIVFLPFCGVFVVILIVIVVAATQGSMRPRIPPPPPIQQPMVPAGQVGPVGLNCPNCGAPPQNVDRFGVATCTYCNTRFLVR